MELHEILATIDTLMDQQDKLTAQLRDAVIAAKENGASWQDVANHTGGTRQAAQQKYGQATKKQEDFDELPLSDQVFAPLFQTAQVHSTETTTEVDTSGDQLRDEKAATRKARELAQREADLLIGKPILDRIKAEKAARK